MKCNECGRIIDGNMKFCKYCGASIDGMHMLPSSNGQVCKRCGAFIKNGNTFCTQCGMSIDGHIENEGTGSEEKKPNGLLRLIVTLLSIILVILIGFLIYWYPVRHFINQRTQHSSQLNKGKDTTKPDSNQEETSEDKTGGEEKGTQKNALISYTIICQDINGITLLTDDSKEGKVGERVTVTPPMIDGYTAQSNSETIELISDRSSNIITFTYIPDQVDTKNTTIEYSIVCVENSTGNNLYAETYIGEIGTDVTVAAPAIEGYTPIQSEITRTLSSIPTENRIQFVYYKSNESEDQKQYEPAITMSAVINITASSSLSEYGMTHSPDRLIDGDITKGWSEGVQGIGSGEYVTFTFDGNYAVSGITISPGLQENREMYKKNSRPSHIEVICDDFTEDLYLQDEMTAQTFMFSSPIYTDHLLIKIIDAIEGDNYEDTVISEISLF